MHRTLFVCLGNICRSPTAEAVFQSFVERDALLDRFLCDSAGILSYHQGARADSRMRRHATARGYKLASISRPVTAEDFETFDLLIGMDHQNVVDLQSRAPTAEAKGKIRLMLDYAPSLGIKEVPDPYYGGAQGFEEVIDLLEVACANLLESLR